MVPMPTQLQLAGHGQHTAYSSLRSTQQFDNHRDSSMALAHTVVHSAFDGCFAGRSCVKRQAARCTYSWPGRSTTLGKVGVLTALGNWPTCSTGGIQAIEWCMVNRQSSISAHPCNVAQRFIDPNQHAPAVLLPELC